MLLFLALFQILQVDDQVNRAMIASLHIAQHLRFSHNRKETIIHQEIVKSLPDITLSVSMLNSPPSILLQSWIQLSKSVHPP